MNITLNMPTASILPGGQAFQSCIDSCNKCAQICIECTKLCLQEPDAKDRVNCINMLMDCADICSLASCYMSRQSMFSKDICNLCATICDKCAQDCQTFKDTHCQVCADTCRTCADECRRMAQM